MSEQYDVIFSGQVMDGKRPDRVQARLRSSLQVDDQMMERLFRGSPVIIRKRVDRATAEKYRKVFQRAGAICEIRRSIPPTAEAVPPVPPVSEPAKTADSKRSTPHPGVGEKVKNHCIRTADGGRMIITNVEYVPGKTIVEHYGLVSGSTIRAKHIGRDFMASLKNLVGGELKGYTELLRESRQQAMDRMVEQARQLGANAIVNVRFSTSSVAQGAAELYAYGTAVRVEG